MEIVVFKITLRWINSASMQFEMSSVPQNHIANNRDTKLENTDRHQELFPAANSSQTVPLTNSALKSNPRESTDKYF